MQKKCRLISIIGFALAFILTSLVTENGKAQTKEDSQGNQKVIKVRLSYDYLDTLHPARFNRRIAKRIEEESNGRVKFEIYPSAMLFKSPEAIEAIQRGNLEMSAIVNSYFMALTPKVGIFELPFAFPERKLLYESIDGEIAAKAFAPLEDKNMKIIGAMDYSYIDITNSKKQIRSINDLKGLKIRAYSAILGDTLTALGASPMFIPGIEVPTALQQKVVDGACSGPDSFVYQKYFEFQKYLTISEHVHCLIDLVVSKKWWDGLPDDIRSLMERIIKEELIKQRSVAIEEEKQNIQTLKEKGMDVYVIPKEERKVWKQATQSVWDKHKEDIGAELVDQLIELNKKYGY